MSLPCSCVGADSANQCSQLNPSDPASDPACTPVPTQEALRLQQDPNSMGWVALNSCILLAILVVIRFLTYVALRHKTSRK